MFYIFSFPKLKKQKEEFVPIKKNSLTSYLILSAN